MDMEVADIDEGNVVEVIDFFRCVSNEASRAPKLFLVFEGALVDRVKVDA